MAQADRYTELINTPIGKLIQKQIGLPAPVPLKRFSPGDSVVDGRVLLGGAPGGRLATALAKLVAEIGAEASTPLREDLRSAAAEAGLDAGPWTPAAAESQRYGALVFDATGITEPAQLDQLREFFSPTIRRVQRSGRLVVLGTPPEQASTPAEQIAQRALEGFTRAAGKELKAGATAQLVYVAPGAEDQLASTLRFLLSSKSTYVDGQVIRVAGSSEPVPALDWDQPLAGKVALVTGASRGIGAAIAATLARDGAHVVGLDIPALESDLKAVTSALGGSYFATDITADDAPRAIVDYLKREHGGADVVVHNAGITRDKTLGRMDEARWNSVIQVNLAAVQRVTDALIAGRRRAALNAGGRIVCVASIAGIAGNFGQTNYATSKAGVIGLVDAYAPLLAKQGATINAVAPGFIETQMTAKIPFATREAGRRMNSLSQGGLPVDVAEAIAYFASPASSGVTGNTVRVCGQSLLGAVVATASKAPRATTRRLSGPPGTLGLYAKAALPLIPGASKLPFVAGAGGRIPRTTLTLDGVKTDANQLAAYDRVCGFTLRDTLPSTFVHVQAFPLHMALMTDGAFPFGAVGLVHLRNRITQLRPLKASETYDLRVHTMPVQPHAKGKTFTIVSEARVGDELVWQDASTMLRRGRGDKDAERPPAQAGPAPSELPFVAEWKLKEDLGRRYGAASGDRNPIHLHAYSAKLLGFPRAIAHGMWTKAHCLAALESTLPDAYTVDVTFKRPILLPSKVAFAAEHGRFAVRNPKDDSKIHLEGTVTAA